MGVSVATRRFTVDEYHRMMEAGILTEDDRVELLDGEIVLMSPIGNDHANCVDDVMDLFGEAPASEFRTRSPLASGPSLNRTSRSSGETEATPGIRDPRTSSSS
jgi:hypothetical protein